MAGKPRTRPALGAEVVSTEDLLDKNGKVWASTVEVHTFPPVPFSPSEALQKAINDGHVSTRVETVEAYIKDGKGKDSKVLKAFRQDYTFCTAQNERGAVALCDGDASEVWKLFSDRFNQSENQNVYVDLRNASAGPEKAIKRITAILATLPEGIRAEAAAKFGIDLSSLNLNSASDSDDDSEDEES